MTLGQLAFDVPLFVSQATLEDQVTELLFDRTTQRITAVEHDVHPMRARETTLNHSTHQLTQYLQALTAFRDERQGMFVGFAVAPNAIIAVYSLLRRIPLSISVHHVNNPISLLRSCSMSLLPVSCQGRETWDLLTPGEFGLICSMARELTPEKIA